MKITNYENLPDPIVNAIKSSAEYKHTPGKYSVTTLEKGVKEILLLRRHEGELEMDAADGIWALLGQLMHGVLENAEAGDSQLKEEYLTVEIPYYFKVGFLPYGVEPDEDYIVEKTLMLSGKFDLYDKKTSELTDYKLTSVWSYVLGGKAEWKQQLAGYAWLMNQLGMHVDKAQNVVIYRDWSKGKSYGSGADYPKRAVQVLKYNFSEKDFEKAYNSVISKFEQILKYENVPDDLIPACTEEERWAKPTTYAVMKKGRKTAMRVLNTEVDAKEWMSANGGDEYVIRPGESTKCKSYCSCCQFCNFWKENCQEEEAPLAQ